MDWRDWDALSTPPRREADLGLLFQALAARKRLLFFVPAAVLLLAAAVFFLEPARYSAQAQVLTAPRLGGLIGLRSSLAVGHWSEGTGGPAVQAQLIASRDLARRAIKDLGLDHNFEFDPVAKGIGPTARALIFLGIARNPARKSAEDRILEAFQNRLNVSEPAGEGLLTIAFQSEDRELAAKAANRIAELYLDMRAQARDAMPYPQRMRILSRATPPLLPLYPKPAVLALSGAAVLMMAFGAAFAMAAPRLPLQGRGEGPVEQPRALGQIRAFACFKESGRQSPRGDDPALPPGGLSSGEEPDDGQAAARIAARILSAPACGKRGMVVLGTDIKAGAAASRLMLGLARELAGAGRSIAICLDGTDGFGFGGPPDAARPSDCCPGLGELLAGTASFAEAIGRDPASRLHFLPPGRGGEASLGEFEHVLEALAGTYDFIFIMAPPLERSDTAKTLAAKADIVVAAFCGKMGSALLDAERHLTECGAGEVLLAALPSNERPDKRRDAA